MSSHEMILQLFKTVEELLVFMFPFVILFFPHMVSRVFFPTYGVLYIWRVVLN